LSNKNKIIKEIPKERKKLINLRRSQKGKENGKKSDKEDRQRN